MRGVLLLLCACGRVGFDSTGDGGARDGATDGPTDAPAELYKLPLGPGASSRGVKVPGASLSPMYQLDGATRLLRSDDGGVTTQECGSVPSYVNAFDANASGRVVVATVRGVFESTDGCATFNATSFVNYASVIRIDGPDVLVSGSGLFRDIGTATTWTPTPSALDGMYANDILGGPTKLIAWEGGILRSVDGATWTAANTGLPMNTRVLGFSRAPNKIYASSESGIYVSNDDGMSWSPVYNAGYTNIVAVDPGDASFILQWFVAGLSVSSNTGASWVPDVRDPLMGRSRVQDIAFDRSGSGRVFVATGRGLFTADDHALAFRLIDTIDAWTAFATTLDANGTRYIATTAGVLRLGSGAPVLGDPGGQGDSTTTALAVFGGSLYTAGRNIARTLDGVTYEEVFSPGAVNRYEVDALSQAGPYLFAGAGTEMLRTTTGTVWTPTAIATALIHTVLALPTVPVQVLIGTEEGLRYSGDEGVSYGALLVTDTITSILQLADGSILIGANNGLYHAATAAGPYTARTAPSITALARRGATVFVATSSNVFQSSDDGVTLSPIDAFTGHRPISLDVEPSTGDLIIGTDGWGVYRIPPP